MIPQYVAAALVSENKSSSHPAEVDSIPTSAGQEDHVSMGNAAGLKALQVLGNAERAVAIELLAGAQAVEFLAPLEPGARRAGGAGVRADALRARARGPVAVRRHRARRSRRSATAPARVEPSRSRDDVRRGDGLSDPLPPSRPYRDAALLHAVARGRDRRARGCDRRRPREGARIVAAGYFVVATGWSWWRFRQRESRRAPDHPTTGGGTSAGDGDGGR